MRMFLAIMAVAVAVGCSHEKHQHAHEDDHDHEHEHAQEVQGVTFEPHTGLSVPPETAQFIGLKIADVEERTMRRETRFEARIFSRADEIPAKASAFVPVATSNLLRPGMTGKVEGGENKLEATVAAIRPETSNGLAEILVTFPPQVADFAMGDSVTISMPVGNEEKVLAVPRAALLETVEGDFVYTASGDHLVRTAVKTGRTDPTHVEVADGLYTGDRIAIQPVTTLWLAELQSIRGGQACGHEH